MLGSKLICFEDIGASSLKVVLTSDCLNVGNFISYMLWHRKADDGAYPQKPTCRLLPNTKFFLSGLTPATEYVLKVVTLDKDREVSYREFQFRTVNSEDELRRVNLNSTEVERSQSPATNCSSLSNPSSVDDEANTVMPSSTENDKRREYHHLPFNGNGTQSAPAGLPGNNKNSFNPCQEITMLHEVSLEEEHCIRKVNCIQNGDATFRNKDMPNGRMIEETTNHHGPNTPQTNLGRSLYPDSLENGLQITPYKPENAKEAAGRKNRRKLTGKGIDIRSKGDEEEPQAGSSSKKRRTGERVDEECTGNGEKDFEYYVKVIRYLECDGHIDTAFRQKFLTWYSLRATPQEGRIVKVFVDMFGEDPESLAEQLIDTFSDIVSNKRCSTVPSGFCLKLWH